MDEQQELENVRHQIDYARRKLERLKELVRQAEGARRDTHKLLDERRGGMLRQPARKLLETLEAIEKEL